MLTLAVFFAVLLLSTLGTWCVLMWLRAKQIMDMPNARSSHEIPTPRGGGLAITPLILCGFIGWFSFNGAAFSDWAMVAAATVLATVSWIDDRITLTAAPRFAIQIAVVSLTLSLMPQSQIFGGLLPSALEKVGLGIAWVWFLNLYNFMDGINGITGVETACIALGLMIVAPSTIPAPLLAIVAASALGFLVWNWNPAKIFMGDVGSIPLGFILGYFLIKTTGSSAEGWAIALILPALYWADATFTILRRGLQRKKIWQAHREHFYQKATQGGTPATRWSHAHVSSIILVGNIALIGMAYFALTMHVWFGLLGASCVTVSILAVFQSKYLQTDPKTD